MSDVKSPLSVDNLPWQNDGSDNKDEPLAVMKKETVSPTLPDMHRSVKSGCRPLLLTSALVFESQVALRKASATKSFQETVQVLIDGTWGLFASSLIVNAIINLILFPEAYAQENKAIYLLSLPLIIGDYLRNALPNPVVSLSLLLIPLGLGLINALISAYRVPLQDQNHSTQIQKLHQQFKLYKPGFWRDLVGWFLTKTLPDAFPVVGLCAFVPQVHIQRALERITFALIWDGRLSLQDRTTLFDYCRRFSRDSRHLTRLQAISVLADVLSGISVSQLQTLQQAGVDNETLKALLFIKTEAFRELRYLANTYYLPQEENQSHLSSLPRYLRANYDLWRLGYPQNHALQPLFLLYQGGRLVLSVFLYVTVGSALVTLFQCLAEGKQWTFIQSEGEYVCNVCADLPIFYRDTFTIKNCFAGYLIIPRPVEGLMAFIDRFDLSTITELNLSNQPALLTNSTALSGFLHRLKSKMVTLTEFELSNFNTENDTEQTIALNHIMDFLDGSSVTIVLLLDTLITQGALDKMASILPNTGIKGLGLSVVTSYESPFFFHNTSTFAQSLLISEVSSLFLDSIPLGDAGLRPIAAVLPKTKIQILSLVYTNITAVGCVFLAEKIMETPKFHYLNIGNNNINNCVPGVFCRESCGMVLAKALSHIDEELLMQNLVFTDAEIGAFANALSATPPPLLKKLVIPIYTFFQDAEAANFSKLIQAIPHSQLTSLRFDPARVLLPLYDYRVSYFSEYSEELVEALYRSNVTDFGWNFACYILITPDNLCPDSCPDGTLAALYFLLDSINIVPYFLKIKHLELSCTGVDAVVTGLIEEIIDIIASVEIECPIETLILGSNPIKEGIFALGSIISRTNLTQVNLLNSKIDRQGFFNFTNYINQSKLRYLSITNNSLGDQAIINLFEAMQGSSMDTVVISNNNITAQGAQSIANLLIKDTPSLPGFWIDLLDEKHLALVEPANNLTDWRIIDPIGDEGATALCQVLPQTQIYYASFISDLGRSSVNQSVIEHCGVFSGVSHLQPPLPFMLFRLPGVVWEWAVSPQQGHKVHPRKIIENHMVIFQQQPVSEETALQVTIPMTHHETIFPMQLYDNLFTLCQTFLQSAGQAAVLATFIPLVTDVLHRYGGYELEKARTISQGLRVSLLFTFSNSKTALTAGFLAHILMSQLTQSPQVIASVTVGTSLVATVLETALTQAVSLPWLILQMGVGFMGAAVGSRIFNWYPRLGWTKPNE